MHLRQLSSERKLLNKNMHFLWQLPLLVLVEINDKLIANVFAKLIIKIFLSLFSLVLALQRQTDTNWRSLNSLDRRREKKTTDRK